MSTKISEEEGVSVAFSSVRRLEEGHLVPCEEPVTNDSDASASLIAASTDAGILHLLKTRHWRCSALLLTEEGERATTHVKSQSDISVESPFTIEDARRGCLERMMAQTRATRLGAKRTGEEVATAW